MEVLKGPRRAGSLVAFEAMFKCSSPHPGPQACAESSAGYASERTA